MSDQTHPPLPVPICTRPVPIHPAPTYWPTTEHRDHWFDALARHGYGDGPRSTSAPTPEYGAPALPITSPPT
ncbi:hypothetical protein ACFVZH_38550 [Streptomyces sp. NPDC059534]|uniref:hypothetical protein n=1 Tax=Streptomyces sp. NPDC059534 TaxID=3346859 RepID=UPI0036A256E6